MRYISTLTAVLFATSSVAAEPSFQELTENLYARFEGQQAVLLVHVNWGRYWGCGDYENAQLQKLTFSRRSGVNGRATTRSFTLVPSTTLFVHDEFIQYAYLIEPGTYALTGYDVRVARSTSEVGHYVSGKTLDSNGGKPSGGRFTANPGEAVYIGHFGLDCVQQPIPWRYYVEGQANFDRYVDRFHQQFPYAKDLPVRYGLLETSLFGTPYSLGTPEENAE